jgi:hypothetical protein
MGMNEALFHDGEVLDLQKTRTIYVHTTLGKDEVSAKRGFYPDLPFATIQYAIDWFAGSVGSTYTKNVTYQWTIELLNEPVNTDIITQETADFPDYVFINRTFGAKSTTRNAVLNGPVTWLTAAGNTITGSGVSSPVIVSFAQTIAGKGQVDTIFKLDTTLTWNCASVTTGAYLYLNLAATGKVTTSIVSGTVIVGRAYRNISNVLCVEQYPYGYSSTIQDASEKFEIADQWTHDYNNVEASNILETDGNFTGWLSGSPTNWDVSARVYAPATSGITITGNTGFFANNNNYGVLSGQYAQLEHFYVNTVYEISLTISDFMISFNREIIGTDSDKRLITGINVDFLHDLGGQPFTVSFEASNDSFVTYTTLVASVVGGFQSFSNSTLFHSFRFRKTLGVTSLTLIGQIQLYGPYYTTLLSDQISYVAQNITTTIPHERVIATGSITGSTIMSAFVDAPDAEEIIGASYIALTGVKRTLKGIFKFNTPGTHTIYFKTKQISGTAIFQSATLSNVTITSNNPVYNQNVLYGSGIKTEHIQNEAVTVEKIMANGDLNMRNRDIINLGPNSSLKSAISSQEATYYNLAFFGGS